MYYTRHVVRNYVYIIQLKYTLFMQIIYFDIARENLLVINDS